MCGACQVLTVDVVGKGYERLGQFSRVTSFPGDSGERGSVGIPRLDDLMKEWETAREMLLKFDEFGHDLRKYGVSFVAGLLTADSLLGLPSSTLSVPHLVKFGAMLSVFVLIIALRLTERNYQVFQTAAASRAMKLEKILGLGLTETITVKYNYQGLWFFGTVVYIFLAGAAGILGAFILSPDLSSSKLQLTNASLAIILAAIATGAAILIIDRMSFSRPKDKQLEVMNRLSNASP